MSEDYDYPEEPIIPSCSIVACRNYNFYGYQTGWRFMLHPDADMSYKGPRDDQGNLPDYSDGAIIAGDTNCCCWYWRACIPRSLSATTQSRYVNDDPGGIVIGPCGSVGCDAYEWYMTGTYRRWDWCYGINDGCDENPPYPEDLFPFEEIEKREVASCQEDCWDGTKYVKTTACVAACTYDWSMGVSGIGSSHGELRFSASSCLTLIFDGASIYSAYTSDLNNTVLVVTERKTKTCREDGCITDDTGTYPISYAYTNHCTATRTRVRLFVVRCAERLGLEGEPQEAEVFEITDEFLLDSIQNEPIYPGDSCIYHADNEATYVSKRAWWWWGWWNPIYITDPPVDPLDTCDDVDLPDFWTPLEKTCIPCYAAGSPFCGNPTIF